ncbi:hypothetical protein GCM10017711_27210 [Paeniglutamicibacter sulfureus]|jgi:hypothetical protein
MCGACARIAPDWAGPMVSGPIRRASIGRFLTGVCRGIKVGTFPGGWTVTRQTGAARTTSNFDELLDLVAPHCAVPGWEALDAALVEYRGSARAEEFSDYLPPPADVRSASAVVLVRSGAAPTHLRLAAFGLGVRALEGHSAAVEFPHRLAPFTMVAVDGTILGSVPLPAPAP